MDIFILYVHTQNIPSKKEIELKNYMNRNVKMFIFQVG